MIDDAQLQQLLSRVALHDRAALRSLYDATAGEHLELSGGATAEGEARIRTALGELDGFYGVP